MSTQPETQEAPKKIPIFQKLFLLAISIIFVFYFFNVQTAEGVETNLHLGVAGTICIAILLLLLSEGKNTQGIIILLIIFGCIFSIMYPHSSIRVAVLLKETGHKTSYETVMVRNPTEHWSAIMINRSFGHNRYLMEATTRDGVVVKVAVVWNHRVTGNQDSFIYIAQKFIGKVPNHEVLSLMENALEVAFQKYINSKDNSEIDDKKLERLLNTVLMDLDISTEGILHISDLHPVGFYSKSK